MKRQSHRPLFQVCTDRTHDLYTSQVTICTYRRLRSVHIARTICTHHRLRSVHIAGYGLYTSHARSVHIARTICTHHRLRSVHIAGCGLYTSHARSVHIARSSCTHCTLHFCVYFPDFQRCCALFLGCVLSCAFCRDTKKATPLRKLLNMFFSS